ncbi:DUF4249 domain-containing protein [Flagellimonas myxillae]|uniref:DUF4249 domain-containing protein n=1 Tax=Flagellimonas myxillae TaxID=2942214 RepID=UPI00201ED257|nr:DUF4249 domain-containing protein [Muricauda myxillae]MCL6265629.1 DUF4249 domain-containing protein [Muricauda myxillae]
MKKSFLLLPILLLMLGCEEVIDPELPTSQTRLVIDALLGYNGENGDPITVGEVKLTLTAPFLGNTVTPALNAQVFIIDESTGVVSEISEEQPGIFARGFPNLRFNRDYTLQVIYNGELYSATERLVESTTIDNLEQGDGFLFDEQSETEVKITITDLPGRRDQYLFSFGFENFLVIEDRFFEDEQITFSYFYEDILPGRLLAVSVFGVDQEFANYVEQVLQQAGEDNGGGGPFTVPATVRGNIVNSSNPDNFAFGYFALSEFDTAFLTIH